MRVEEVLKNPAICLPLDLPTDDIVAGLRSVYKNFNNVVSGFNGTNKGLMLSTVELEKIRKIQKSLLDVLDSSLRGLPSTAYAQLKNVMKTIERETGPTTILSKLGTELTFQKFYRFRISQEIALSPSELFHVPFSKRRKVAPYRFSISGLPALYLGSSAYICWEEMGRPLLDDIHASRFELEDNQRFSFLNLSLNQHFLTDFLSDFPNEVFDSSRKSQLFVTAFKCYIITWPLLAACHIRVRSPSDYFKPEYIVPQLVTQFVTKEKAFDGILYFSTRVMAHHVEPQHCVNLVLPAKKNTRGQDYCSDLVQKTSMTAPVSLRLLRAFAQQGMPTASPPDFEIAKGLRLHYVVSDFGLIERELGRVDLQKVTLPNS